MKRSREPEDEAKAGPANRNDQKPAQQQQQQQQPGSPAAKITELDESATSQASDPVMTCSLPGHRDAIPFASYSEYESHYTKSHTNRCITCSKNFPSAHVLDLHIEECHDALAAVRREKGDKTYSCLVAGCDKKCSTPQSRRLHLIEKHAFPKNYFFAVTKEGVDGRSSLLLEGGHRRGWRPQGRQQHGDAHEGTQREKGLHEPASEGSSVLEADVTKGKDAGKTEAAESDGPLSSSPANVDADMDDLTGAMSSLRFVPRSVQFGRGKGKSGFAKK